jgi:hypothetical protein
MKIPNLIAVEQRYTKIVLDYHPRLLGRALAAASFLAHKIPFGMR